MYVFTLYMLPPCTQPSYSQDVDNFGMSQFYKICNLYVTYLDVYTAHIGGFLVGLLSGIVLYPIISPTKRHKIVVWVIRLTAIPLIVVLYVVLTRNFYKSDPYAGMCSR